MKTLTDNQKRMILGHLHGGRKIEAIKEYRTITGCDLTTAKEAIEAVESGRVPEAEFGTFKESLNDDQQAAVIAHLKAGNKIEAIKAYRSHVGCDLKTAKDAVEALAEANGIELPTATGCGSAAILFLAIGTAALALIDSLSS